MNKAQLKHRLITRRIANAKLPVIGYDTIRSQIQSGDVVLFSGRGLTSTLIKMATLSDISHVGMFYRDRNDIFIWESTSLYKEQNGVQLNLASARIADYNGKVYYRPLVYDRPHIFYEILNSLRIELKDVKYEQSLWELIKAVLPFRNKENLTTIFCSELIAYTYQRLRLLPTGVPSNEYTPHDSEMGGMVDEGLKLSEKPACLGRMARIK